MTENSSCTEIRWHGRGGQGAVTSAELVARAAIDEGKFAQAFPAFGAERRGAPVVAFVRVDPGSPIRVRAEVTNPDIVVVLDPGLLRVVNVTDGLKPDGLLVVNSKKTPEEVSQAFGFKGSLATVDAGTIAREVLGVNIVNTSMIGALIKASSLVGLDAVVEPMKDRFGRLGQRNIDAMKRAYEETVLKEAV